MNWVKGFALVTCLAVPLSAINAVSASADSATGSTSASSAMTTKTAMTDDEKKAKAADCSKQADAKKLHGEERRKFRASCKKA